LAASNLRVKHKADLLGSSTNVLVKLSVLSRHFLTLVSRQLLKRSEILDWYATLILKEAASGNW
jgi:hypothetical protein